MPIVPLPIDPEGKPRLRIGVPKSHGGPIAHKTWFVGVHILSTISITALNVNFSARDHEFPSQV
jgi:hypothetical protein